MTSEGDQMRCMKKKQEPMLFGVHLTQLYTNFSHDDHPLEASLERETRANQVPELEGSGSNSTSSTQGSKPRIFNCSRKFRNSYALGGHQNAHKKERTARKSNPIPNSLPTHSFQYPTPAMFASNGKISHFDQLPQDFRVEFEPCSFSSLRRARNDPQQQKATPDRMLTLSTQEVEPVGYFPVGPNCILSRREINLRNRTIGQVKVQWKNLSLDQETWELESHMREAYPILFHGDLDKSKK